MEILKIFFILIAYYIFFTIKFYFKVFLFLFISINISFYLEYIENKDEFENSNNFLYKIFIIFLKIYHFLKFYFLKFLEFKTVNYLYKKIYSCVYFLNRHYIIGRNTMLNYSSKMALISYAQKVPKKQKIIFKNNNEMENFLDSLITKKKIT